MATRNELSESILPSIRTIRMEAKSSRIVKTSSRHSFVRKFDELANSGILPCKFFETFHGGFYSGQVLADLLDFGFAAFDLHEEQVPLIEVKFFVVQAALGLLALFFFEHSFELSARRDKQTSNGYDLNLQQTAA